MKPAELRERIRRATGLDVIVAWDVHATGQERYRVDATLRGRGDTLDAALDAIWRQLEPLAIPASREASDRVAQPATNRRAESRQTNTRSLTETVRDVTDN